jgi:pilus assembly protein Flp/PilA
MSSVISRIRDFVVSEDGPTAVEYAVMLSLIIVACISIVTTLGKTVSNTFGSTTNAIGS